MLRLVEVTKVGVFIMLEGVRLSSAVLVAGLSVEVMLLVVEIEGAGCVLIELLEPMGISVNEATVPVKDGVVVDCVGIVLENCWVVPGIIVKEEVYSSN